MSSWFGPLDGFLRTASALGAYLFITWLEDAFSWDLPWISGEAIALVIALLISGLGSKRLWGLPALQLTWAVGDKVFEERVFQIRTGDARKRRLITHSVVGPERSLLSMMVMRRLKKGSFSLCVRIIPDGAFHLSEDLSLPTVRFQHRQSGFSHTLPDLGEVGVIAMTRVEWEPAQPGLPIRCKVKYSLETGTSSGRWLSHLVHLDANVRMVEIGH